MICSGCGESTPEAPCEQCGASPLLDRQYRLDEVISRGSGGTTYRGTELSEGWAVAIKELPLHGTDAKQLELARRAAGVLRQLHHPGIPSYLNDVVAGKGRHRALFLVQEFIHGRNLAQEMERHRYDEDEVLDAIEELLGILRYLHGLSPPILHRDLALDNIMRRLPQQRLVLVDFGSVRDAMADPQLGGSTVTGTFGYAAPEQLAGDATPATDLYGLGAVAAAMLTRKDPREMTRRGGGLDWGPHVEVRPSTADLLTGLLQPDPAARIDHDEAGRLIRRARKERERVRPPAPKASASPLGNELSRPAPSRGDKPAPLSSVRAAARGDAPGPRLHQPPGPVGPAAVPAAPEHEEERVRPNVARWLVVFGALMLIGIAMAGLGTAFVVIVFDGGDEAPAAAAFGDDGEPIGDEVPPADTGSAGEP